MPHFVADANRLAYSVSKGNEKLHSVAWREKKKNIQKI